MNSVLPMRRTAGGATKSNSPGAPTHGLRGGRDAVQLDVAGAHRIGGEEAHDPVPVAGRRAELDGSEVVGGAVASGRGRPVGVGRREVDARVADAAAHFRRRAGSAGT